MANRILRWIVYTLVLALLPTLITLLFSVLFNISVRDCSTELLFFVIMICATSLNDIQETKQKITKDFIFNLFFGVCIIMIIAVSVIYGSILFMEMTNNVTEIINENIKVFSIILSILSGLIGLIIQIILFRTEVSE